MGWVANAIVVAGAFLGYKYLQHNSGQLQLDNCGKMQCNAIKSEQGFPDLTDDQKVVLSDTVRELSMKAGKVFETEAERYRGLPVILQDGNGIQKSFLILIEDGPTLTSRLASIGLGVSSLAGGILVQGGMNLLDPDVLTGVATMQKNYQLRNQRNDPSIGLGDNFNQRRQLDELERQGY